MHRMIVSWFGSPWEWPALRTRPRSTTPLGSSCIHCEQQILIGDQGLVLSDAPDRPLHRSCFYAFLFNKPQRRAQASRQQQTLRLPRGRGADAVTPPRTRRL